jgi:hypothetical protein
MKIKISQNIKISAISIIALIIAFSTSPFIEKICGSDCEKEETVLLGGDFFSTRDFSQNRISFLIGSSHVGHINVTQVNDLIHDDSITIYNLAIGEDSPSERVNSLEQIISAKPEIIFYGISYRDFNFPYQNTVSSILLDPQQTLSSKLHDYNQLENIFPSNPQWLTRNIIDKVLKINEKEPKKEPDIVVEINTPFYSYFGAGIISTDDELKNKNIPVKTWVDSKTKIENIYDLKKIISEVQKHGTKVIIFTTPLHQYYLDELSNSQKNQLDFLLNDLRENHDVKIYKFEKKYSELNMWNDLTHISLHRNVTEYNYDVAEMIQIEIKP